MKKKFKNVRKIRFGLRYKFSIVIIAGIAFVSTLIGLAVFNQHQLEIQEEMHRLGEIILKGSADDAQKHLYYDYIIDKNRKKDLSDKKIKDLKDKRKESLLKAADYFAGIVKKEKFLDIAFLIKVNWKDIDINWNDKDQAEYIYFSRKKGKIHSINKSDPQLKPSIFRHYMHKINTKTYLAFTKGRDKTEKSFVLVGMPLFKNLFRQKDKSFYNEYLQFQRPIFKSIKDIRLFKKKQKYFERKFIQRLVFHNTSLNYLINLDKKRKQKILYYFIPRYFDIKSLKKREKNELKNLFMNLLETKIADNQINLFELKKIIISLTKKYNLPLKESRSKRKSKKISQKKQDPKEFWKKLYYFLRNNKIDVSSPIQLEQLALLSFRKDLSGIVGLFLLRTEFFSEIKKSRDEIINLSISILFRCIFIALFFPTFIIRSVSTLATGALEIGKGNLDKKIDIPGSDELGRLADIFNVMTSNLKNAQESMLEKQRMQEELKTAQYIQQTLLPEEYPDLPNIEYGAYYSAQTESGGDYFDFIKLENNNLGIAIADVSGHGVGSGLVMAMTRTLLHIFCKKYTSTKKILNEINDYLYINTASNYFVSMFYAILDIKHKKLNFSSAGHNPGILLRNNDLKELPAGGIALGAVGIDTFQKMTDTKSITLQKGDFFIQYTDGIVEAMDKDNNEYGEERFYEAIKRNSGKSPNDLIESIISDVSRFTGGIQQNDDITMIAIKIS